MNDLVSLILSIIYSGTLIFGTGYTIKEISNEVRKAGLKKAATPLSSSESLANALTGEKTGF